MNVPLPSGAVAPLEPADLRRLLANGGTLYGLCVSVWAHPGLDVKTVIRNPDDAVFVADWAIRQFIDTDEAAELSSVCERYHDIPSRRVGISDAVFAFMFDQGCALRLSDLNERENARAAGHERGFNSGEING